jgi:hypothetical protein
VTGLRFIAWCEASARQAFPDAVAREIEQFKLLSRDSVRRLLSAASMSRETDPAQFALWATVLVSVPPAMYAVHQLLNYSAMRYAPAFFVDLAIQADRMFFVLYGMLAAALLAAVMWEALLPDRTDQEIVGSLPVRARTLTAARLSAALIVVTMFSLPISLPAGIILAVAAPSHPALGFLPTVFAAHVIATMGGSLCVFALLLIVRGVIAFCLGEHVSQRLATVLQLVTVAALAEVFFFIPGMLPAMVTRMIFGDPSATALPPVWFAALYSWFVGTPHAALASTALLAPIAFASAVVLVIPVYLLPAAVLARRTIETQPRQHAGVISTLARSAAVALPSSAVVRGILVFIVASLLRSRRHRLIVTGYAGLAAAIGTMSMMARSIRGTIALDSPGISMLSLPLVLMFFVALGLRAAFAVPTDVDANWSFRLAQPPVMAAIDATAIAIALVGMVPIAASASAAAFFLGWGPYAAVSVGALDLLSATVLVEWALADWRKVPFTCGHMPDPESLRSRWLLYIVPLIVFAFVNAAIQRYALASTRAMFWYGGIAAVAIAILRLRRWLAVRRLMLQFDASPADAMATLSLSEALH